MRAFQAHLNKWLMLYVVAAIGLGILLGRPQAHWISVHQGAISTLTTVAVFLIIYPMMVNLRFGGLLKASKNVRGIALAVIFNFLWAPVLGYGLVHLFFPNDPMLALGFLLVMVVPCSSMSIGYTGLSKGNLELATVVVALSFVLAVVAVPVWMTLFAANYAFPLPVHDMVITILEVLLAPMLLGPLTRVALTQWLGAPRFQRLQPIFPAVSLLAMNGIVFLIFFSKATMIVDKWNTVLLLLVPNALFIGGTLVVLTWLNRRLGLSYEDNMAVVFSSTGKNNGTAIAIASMAFSPMVAIPAATMPIFQIVLMVLYLKMAVWIRAYFAHRAIVPVLEPGAIMAIEEGMVERVAFGMEERPQEQATGY